MIEVRRATPADAEAIVRLHAEASAYYAELEPALFQAPDLEGYAYPRDVTRTRLEIAYLATATAHRRTGAGKALVEAAEAWGRERGATVAEASTYHRGTLSVPFWTDGADYAPRSIVFRKEL